MRPLLDYFHAINKLKRKRERYLSEHQVPDSIRALLSAPLPGITDDLYQLEYVALDFETTGFYPENDHLLSVGYLPINNQQIAINNAVEHLVKSSENIKAETAVINHIVPEMLENGLPIVEVMNGLFAEATGKVLIAHGCIIEKRFIDHYVATQFGLPPLPLLWVDTLTIEKSFTVHRADSDSTDFRLTSIRTRHGLPEYPAHGALIDALATAELYLALLKKRFSGAEATFRGLKTD